VRTSLFTSLDTFLGWILYYARHHALQISHLAEIMPIRFDIVNCRVPAILDKTGEVRKKIFESGAVMLYLCQGYDAEGRVSYPFDSDK
jgi:hypothetical protein